MEFHDSIIFRQHAIMRMFEREIRIEDIRHILASGQVIEEYPNAEPYPCSLVMGYVHDRPLHIVIARNDEDRETIIITVYEPDPDRWDEELKRRKKDEVLYL